MQMRVQPQFAIPQPGGNEITLAKTQRLAQISRQQHAPFGPKLEKMANRTVGKLFWRREAAFRNAVIATFHLIRRVVLGKSAGRLRSGHQGEYH